MLKISSWSLVLMALVATPIAAAQLPRIRLPPARSTSSSPRWDRTGA
jgi:hypothetical protein